MTVDSVLFNAKAYLNGAIVDCSLAINEGVIEKIGNETQMPKADEKTDVQHMLILPGIIDSHVHLRDEENAYKETFMTGTAAAAFGGVTSVLDMPNNTPVTMSAETLRNRIQIACRRILVNVGFFSEFPLDPNDINFIVDEGAVGFKLFMGEQVGGMDIDRTEAMIESFTKVSELCVPIAVHAEDHNLLKTRIEQLKLNNRHDMAAFLKAHDETVELAAVKRVLEIAAQIEKAHIHFCHISTQKALQEIAEAKRIGKAITCEATPHHLLLTKNVYEGKDSSALTIPPLRSREDVEALWKGILGLEIDTIGSDHAPHTLEEKEAASIWDAKAGLPGLETTLPLILTLVHKDRLTLADVLRLLCERPAKIFSLKNRGSVEERKAADLIVVDFNKKFMIDVSKFQSKAKFSPFNKWEVQGKIIKTYVNGQLIMEDSEIVGKPGTGKIIRRNMV